MDNYSQQVRLLLQVLPPALAANIFALKGGTAINLFRRNMPRLSVDIDLAYILPDAREVALENIHNALQSCRAAIEGVLGKAVRVVPVIKDGHWKKLNVYSAGAVVKIEPNDALRGVIEPPEILDLCDAAQEQFLLFASVPVQSMADLYGGKICAALDRQHPRDLFDIGRLIENEGITEEILKGFVVYLASHNRPTDELLKPNKKDIREIFKREFSGMTTEAVTAEYLEDVREELLRIVSNEINPRQRQFLLSVQLLHPDWTLLGLPVNTHFPAVEWKVRNLRRLQNENREKYVTSCEKLHGALKI